MKGVVTKVTAGEADAGIVYVTDVQRGRRQAPRRSTSRDINVVAKYPIAAVKTSTNADVDQAFIDFVLGADGQAILAKYGFLRAVTVTASAAGRSPRHRRVGRERLARPGPRPGDRRHRLLRAAVHRPAVEGAVGRRLVDPHAPTARSRRCGCRSSARCGRRSLAVAVRRAAGLAAGPGRVPGPGRWCGRCARCRWCCRRSSAASRCSTRSAAAASSASTSTVVRHHAAVHDRGRDRRRRRSWPCRSWSSPSRRRSASSTPATRRPPARSARSRWYVFRRVTLPAIRPGARRRRRAGLGPGARRVRRHDHLRRQLPGPHPDHAARHLPRQRDRPGRGDRAEPRAHRRVVRACSSPCATGSSAAADRLRA